MTLADRLSEEERLAGLALLVKETLLSLNEEVAPHVRAHRRKRAKITLHHWCISRHLPIGGQGDVSRAILDAVHYVSEHPDEVARFRTLRDRERRMRPIGN